MKSPDQAYQQLREKILERIDFLSDHWVMGDDRPPFSFGGWREEIVNDILSTIADAIYKLECSAPTEWDEWHDGYADCQSDVLQLLTPPLTCEKHSRILIGKDVCVDCQKENQK